MDINKEDKIATITLCDPGHLNSLTFEDFLQIGQFLQQLNTFEDEVIQVTVLQSSGRMFSSGGKFEAVMELQEGEEGSVLGDPSRLRRYMGNIATPTIDMIRQFINHKHPIICCLNGPAIGLSACMVLLCDLVAVKEVQDDKPPFLLFPFSSLGFVTEAGSSVTLLEHLGYNTAMEHLIFSTPVFYQEMVVNGMVWKTYPYIQNNDKTTQEFNTAVRKDIKSTLQNIHPVTLSNMRSMLVYRLKQKFDTATTEEIMGTLPLWLSGEPHRRFKLLAAGKRRHKL